MRLRHGHHLAYCSNIAAADSWAETFAFLDGPMRSVRDRVRTARPSADEPFAIGLRLSDRASRELSADRGLREDLRRWLDREGMYVFTINGFPFGRFHGGRVKEQVYRPDWTDPARLAYTNRLFDLLSEFLPAGVSGSVSTLPGSFKEFDADEAVMRGNLWACVDHIETLCARTGQDLHLGLEPEPLGWFETSGETVAFFERLGADRPCDGRLSRFLGVNYDTCHLAVEFEEPADALARFRSAGIRISKIHLSSALSVAPSRSTRLALGAFADDVYLHQVIARGPLGTRQFRDLPEALAADPSLVPEEWRIHFHVPLHADGGLWFEPTTPHLLGVLDALASDPSLCAHLEMETYTWAVLPAALRSDSIDGQIAAEYAWTLARLQERGLA
jgi:sugar phosphate isomerase/epimerase